MNWEVWTMKSRTLSSELTVLRKDLTRFSPVWLSLSALLVLFAYELLVTDYKYREIYYPNAWIFAPISALALFGYLTDPTECCAVHSLPIRREKLFLLHAGAGFLMYLIPTAVFCAITAPLVGPSFLFRFGWNALEFAYLFSIAVFCMLVTGRKVGAALLYLFFQCLPALIGTVIDMVYLPELPGIYLDYSFLADSPSLVISRYMDAIQNEPMGVESWLIAAVCLVQTLVIFGVCLLMYRKRKLERAGDLLAVKWLDPVFASCSGLTGACVLDLLFGIGGYGINWPMFLLGMAIGYLAYWMLSKKSARVFTPRVLAGLAALAAAVAISVVITGLDPFGRVGYVPDPARVQQATLGEYAYSGDKFSTGDPEQIAALEALQLELLEDHLSTTQIEKNTNGRTVHITYQLKNGRRLRREYSVRDGALLDRAAWYLSQPIAIIGSDDPDIREIDVRRDGEHRAFPLSSLEDFLVIFLEDCRQGRMFSFDYKDYSKWTVVLFDEDGYSLYVTIPVTAEDTVAWLEENCGIAK